MFLSRIARPFRTVPIPARERSRWIVAMALGALAGLPVQAQFTYNVTSGTTTENNTLTGSGSLTKSGAGTLKLTGANTYSGGTILEAGTLNLTNNSAGGTSFIAVGAAELRIAGGLNVGNDLPLTGNATLYSEAAGFGGSATFSGNISESGGSRNLILAGEILSEVYLTGSNSYTGRTTIDKVTVVISSASQLGTSAGEIWMGRATYGQLRATADITLAHDVSLDGTSISFLVDSGATLTLTGNISGTRHLVHKGSGTLAISGSNSFDGQTTITSGTIAVSSNDNFGDGAVIFGLGTLRATETFEMTTAVEASNSFNKLLRFEVDAGKTLTLNAPARTYQDGLVKTGDGTFVWKYGTSSWGNTEISNGTFRLEGANNRLDTSKSVTLSGDGVLDLNDLDQSLPDIDGSSGTGIDLGSGTLTVKPGSGVSADFAGTVSGSGSLDIDGAGSMEISGALNHTGGTNVLAGTLTLSGVNQAEADLDVSSGAFLELDGINLTLNSVASNSPQFDGVVSGTGSITHAGTWTVNLMGANTFSGGVRATNSGTLHLGHNQAAGTGNISLAGGPLRIASGLTVANNIVLEGNHAINAQSGTSTLTGVISETGGSRQLTKTGDGTFVLSGANTFSGGLTISGDGAVQLAHNQAAGTGNITLAGGPLRIADGLTVANNIILEGNHTINAQSGTSTLSGVISETGGSRQLSKTGDGTFVLSGANTFSGGLTISGDGAVQLGNAAGAGSGTITVSAGSLNLGDQSISNAITLAGGTLTGAGTLNSPTIASGTIAPGNSPGLMTFNTALTLNSSTLIQMELGGTTRGTQYDAINVTGLLTQAGTLTVTLIDSFAPSASDSFQLFNATSIGGSFATTNLPTLSEGLSWNTDNLASTGTISVTGSAVPEPAAFATLLGLFVIGFTAVRRRR